MMPARAAPLRLVLDTNVWLDWLVFDDTAIAPLKRAQAAGNVEICIDEACELELAAVLDYDLGKFTLDVNSRQAKLAEFNRLVCPHPGARTRYWQSQPLAGSAPERSLPPRIATRTPCRERPPPLRRGGSESEVSALPKCRDADDQKFLELARDCSADYLVTKDKALLVLARRKTRPPPCRIVTPCEMGGILGNA